MEDRNRPDTSGEDRGSKGRDFRRKTNHNDDDNEKIGEAPRTPQPDSPINPYYDSHGTSTSNRGSNNIFQQVRSGMPKFSLPNKTSFTLPPAATNLFNFGKRGSGNSINSPPVTEAAASTSVEMGKCLNSLFMCHYLLFHLIILFLSRQGNSDRTHYWIVLQLQGGFKHYLVITHCHHHNHHSVSIFI